jgi:hypothetical protein
MSESKLQIAMVKWFRLQYPDYVLYAIPNGGNRSAITGAIIKAEGTIVLGLPTFFNGSRRENFTGYGLKLSCQRGSSRISKRTI